MNSWVIVNAETGEAVMETFDRSIANRVTKKYKAVPARKYLEELNDSIKRENKE